MPGSGVSFQGYLPSEGEVNAVSARIREIGILFGTVPAICAPKLDPVERLRYQSGNRNHLDTAEGRLPRPLRINLVTSGKAGPVLRHD